MKEPIRERRLRLWKIRQEAEGYDVSKVHTLDDAERFFKKKKHPRVKSTEKTQSEADDTDDTVETKEINNENEQSGEEKQSEAGENE